MGPGFRLARAGHSGLPFTKRWKLTRRPRPSVPGSCRVGRGSTPEPNIRKRAGQDCLWGPWDLGHRGFPAPPHLRLGRFLRSQSSLPVAFGGSLCQEPSCGSAFSWPYESDVRFYSLWRVQLSCPQCCVLNPDTICTAKA